MDRHIRRDGPEIWHEANRHRFVAEVDGKLSMLSYDRLDAATLEYRYTLVPEEQRNRGIGSRLVQHALDWAADTGHSVVPACPFVRHYVASHPENARVIARRGLSDA